MAERKPPTSEEFAAMLQRAGLKVAPTQQAELSEGYALLQPHLERLRRGATPGDEPAIVFQADKAGRP